MTLADDIAAQQTPYAAIETALHALNDLLAEHDQMTATLGVIHHAWTEMDPNDRRQLGQAQPRLVNALLLLERLDLDGEKELNGEAQGLGYGGTDDPRDDGNRPGVVDRPTTEASHV